MSALPRLLDDKGPHDELRAALRDARRGASEGQLQALKERVQARAAAHSAPPFARITPVRVLLAAACIALLGPVYWHQTEPAPTAPALPLPTPQPAREGAPVVPPSDDVAEATYPSLVPAAPAAPAKRARARAQRAPVAPAVGLQTDGDVDELLALQRASRLLMAKPARALELAQEHEQRFVDSMFLEEREAIVIEALLRTSRHEEAARRRRSFDARFPLSNYRQRLDGVQKHIEN